MAPLDVCVSFLRLFQPCAAAHAPVARTRVSGRQCLLAKSLTLGQTSRLAQRRSVVVRAESQEPQAAKVNQEFGYSRKDVIIIGVALIAGGYGLYYGLQVSNKAETIIWLKTGIVLSLAAA